MQTGGILTLPSVGLAECYSLSRILEEKLTSEAGLHYSAHGKALDDLASAQAKIRYAIELMGKNEDHG